MAIDTIRQAVTGPVASVPTLFDRHGNIDEDALRNYVEFVLAGGARCVLLTYGDSLYSLLSDQEVAELTKLVAQQVAGRALVVAADRQWALPQEVEFARYARETGADVLMVLPPDWAGSCTPDDMVEHYAAVAAHIPVMVVTNVLAPRGATFGLRVIERLRDEVKGVVAVKDDICGEFARKLGLLTHDRWAVISGGQKQNHLNALPYGCDGYLSTFIKFKPEIAHRYWAAIGSGSLAAAAAIINQYDMPLFDYTGGLRGGFDAGLHGALELFGVAQRWRRKPYHSLTDEEMEGLADFFRGLDLM